MKESLKLAIIGAGSSYTPELIDGLSNYKESLPIHKIYLFDLEKQIFREYSDELVVDKPITLTKRGVGGYSTVAIGIMDAIYNDTDKSMVVNVSNNGTLSFLPDEAVIETACFVSKDGIKPLNIENYPKEVIRLISSVKTYESLAVEAAIKGDRNLALKALVAHPLVYEYDIAMPLLEEMSIAHKDNLPKFFGDWKC